MAVNSISGIKSGNGCSYETPGSCYVRALDAMTANIEQMTALLLAESALKKYADGHWSKMDSIIDARGELHTQTAWPRLWDPTEVVV